MKPGKPSLYATLKGNRHIFGLPGNPLSSMTGFHEYALPALRRLSGVSEKECRPAIPVRLAAPVFSKTERVLFTLTRLMWTDEGPLVEPVKWQSSADLVAGGQADGTISIPGDVEKIAGGSLVEFRPWRPLP